jgi:hypothetical protein
VKDEIEEQLGRDKLKNDPKSDFIAKMWRTRKVDGS